MLSNSGAEPIKNYDLQELVRREKNKGKKLKGRKGKRKAKALAAAEQADDFVVDTADPRFGAMHSNPDFHLDPTDPNFHATAGMKALLAERHKKQKR